MKIIRKVYDEIMMTVGRLPPETGGILGSRDLDTITEFYFDVSAETTGHSYTPDIHTINTLLERWTTEGIYLVGVIHSHSAEFPFPSCMDLKYGEKILRTLSHLERFYLPIVMFGDEGGISAYELQIGEDERLKVNKTETKII